MKISYKIRCIAARATNGGRKEDAYAPIRFASGSALDAILLDG